MINFAAGAQNSPLSPDRQASLERGRRQAMSVLGELAAPATGPGRTLVEEIACVYGTGDAARHLTLPVHEGHAQACPNDLRRQEEETVQKLLDDQHKDIKLQIQGLVPPGQQLHRNVLFDQLYASIPKDPEAKVQIYTAELAPNSWTNFHCHNGATFFLALQGVFEAHFEEGILIRTKAGDVYSEPIGKMHRGHNPHETLPYLCVAFCVTAPDRDHVTNVIKAF